MREPLFVTVIGGEARTAKDFRDMYGEGVAVTRKGRFTLVHLDRPSGKTIELRLRELRSGLLFSESCQGCRHMRKHGGDLIYGLSAGLPGEEWEELRAVLEAISHGHR